MTRMKGMLLATALMIAAAQSNDPFRTPRRNTGVRRNDNQRKPEPRFVWDIIIKCVETGTLVLYRMIESPLNSMYISK